VVESPWGVPSGLAWSPDSRWLAFADVGDNTNARIMIHGLEDRSLQAATSARVHSTSPAWSADGKWLYFLSDRDFVSLVGSPWGKLQPDPYLARKTRLYLVSLSGKEMRSPFLRDDEIARAAKEAAGESDDEHDTEGGKTDDDAAAGEDDDAEPPVVEIEFDGIMNRVMVAPVPRGNYTALEAARDTLFWLSTTLDPERKTSLMALKIANEKKAEPETVVEKVTSYQVSADRKHVLVRHEKQVLLVPAKAEAVKATKENTVDLEGWRFAFDPREEWRQMFLDAWRMERDYFYDPGMHGVDWERMRQKYLPLVDRITTRGELSDLLGQLIGELSALHMYVRGGDMREGEDQIEQGSLGARLARDAAAGGHRVEHVYLADPDFPDLRSPLARPEVGVSVGDIITAIDGVDTLSVHHIGALLRDKAGKQVLLHVRSDAAPEPRAVIVKPLDPAAARNLRYEQWEYTRRRAVEEASNGRIGYVHLRAMSGRNYGEWARNYYPVFNRQGLILDVRHNSGGNIDSWILSKLIRPSWMYWQGRVGRPTWNMQYAFRGHLAVLCDERTASDGEAFAEGFRRLELGPVIGTRTWGGEIWLAWQNRLVDNGIASAAEYGVYGPEGAWLIEGHGVDPDIVVDNLPHATFGGEDAQLQAAIDHLLERIAEDPRDVPPPPEYPDKSFRR
jgi:tricorn protease